MARKASTVTLYRNAVRDLKRIRDERQQLQAEVVSLRYRAVGAEAEVVEWKKRFDALLARTPKVEVE